jgi:hypothetical protein
MKNMIRETAEEILQEYTNCYSEADEDCLIEMLKKLASDVARDIFEKLEKDLLKSQAICDKQADKCGWNLERRREFEGESDGIGYCLQKIAKLKKKYTESEKEK